MQYIPNWKKWLSYLIPLRLERRSSALNRVLDVDLYRAKLLLNTQNANYSYGRLHHVMTVSLEAAKEMGSSFQSVLMLGFGGGSAAKLIHELHDKNAEIHAIEIDPLVIEVAKKWFYTQNVNLVLADAFEFIDSDKGQYDLIISDIFRDIYMPDLVKEIEFYRKCSALLKPNGIFLQNLMMPLEEVENQTKKFQSVFKACKQINMYRSNTILLGLK